MVGRTSGRRSTGAREPKSVEIELVNKGIDETNGIFFGDILV